MRFTRRRKMKRKTKSRINLIISFAMIRGTCFAWIKWAQRWDEATNQPIIDVVIKTDLLSLRLWFKRQDLMENKSKISHSFDTCNISALWTCLTDLIKCSRNTFIFPFFANCFLSLIFFSMHTMRFEIPRAALKKTEVFIKNKKKEKYFLKATWDVYTMEELRNATI